jgi:hypothetical protein
MKVQYNFPWAIIPGLISAILRKSNRSFRVDTEYLMTRIYPPVDFIGSIKFLDEKPLLLTVNHYSHPGFSIMWAAIAISHHVPFDVHWLMTNAWVYPNPLQNMVLKPLSHWILGEISRIYQFTSMPPMPPTPADAANRVMAIRNLFDYARNIKMPVIGIAPEGRDIPDGILGWPPSGTGRLIFELSKKGFSILPIGAYEEGDTLHIRFGKPYKLITDRLLTSDLDKYVSRKVMCQIAKNVPRRLRGDFA